MKKQLLITAGVISLFAACKKDDGTPAPSLEIPYSNLTATTDYFKTFVDDGDKTTVDFSGQTTRINMLKELDAYVKKGTTTTLDASKLVSMFENSGSPFADAALNSATDKTLISKTAQSFAVTAADAERQRFKDFFTAVAVASTHNGTAASAGVAGILTNASGSKYLMNEKGFEYAQFIQKGMMGAMMLDQISNIYLGTDKQSADNKTVVDGKNYTALEHHWDEAYGYLTQNEYFPKKNPDDATKWLESFLGSYVRQVGAPNGDPAQVYMAFLKGRAAIVNNDTKTRDEQIAYIRTSLEKAIATIAISYLNKANAESNDGAKFHALSEGVGFIYSLRFADNANVNAVKSD